MEVAEVTRAEITQARERRHDALNEMRVINEVQAAENRVLTAGELRSYDALETEIEGIDAKLGRADQDDISLDAGAFIPVDGALGRGPRVEGRSGENLGREQRVADWVARSSRRGPRSTFSEDNAREFRLGRLVAGMISGNWSGAELEQRAYAEGSGATGGFTVPQVLSGPPIDLLRSTAQVTRAGARTIMLGSNDHSIPRLNSGATATWRAEASKVNESSGTFDRISFHARTLAVLARISYELADDMIDGSAQLIERDLMNTLALKLDYGALRGTGLADTVVAAGGSAANLPLGVRNQPGVEILSVGTNGAATSNLQAIIAAAGHVQARNLTPNAAIMSARTQQDFGGLVDAQGQPLRLPAYLDGVEFLPTNQIPDNLTQGTSGDTSEIYVGDWSQLWIGMRPVLGIQVRPLVEKYADTMEHGILAWLRADVALAHPEGFTVVKGVRPGAAASSFTSTINP